MTATSVMKSSFQAVTRPPRSGRASVLTAREMEVLSAMAGGKSNAAIADALVITRKSVEKHINSIFAKLNLNDEPQEHPRVRAVLLYLAEARPDASLADLPSGRPAGATHPRHRPPGRTPVLTCRHVR